LLTSPSLMVRWEPFSLIQGCALRTMFFRLIGGLREFHPPVTFALPRGWFPLLLCFGVSVTLHLHLFCPDAGTGAFPRDKPCRHFSSPDSFETVFPFFLFPHPPPFSFSSCGPRGFLGHLAPPSGRQRFALGAFIRTRSPLLASEGTFLLCVFFVSSDAGQRPLPNNGSNCWRLFYNFLFFTSALALPVVAADCTPPSGQKKPESLSFLVYVLLQGPTFLVFFL